MWPTVERPRGSSVAAWRGTSFLRATEAIRCYMAYAHENLERRCIRASSFLFSGWHLSDFRAISRQLQMCGGEQ